MSARGLGVFLRAFMHPDLLRSGASSGQFDAFNRWESRRFRYEVLWACYANTAFWDEVHRWSVGRKVRSGLYTYTRPVFNPVQRLVEFHATHTYGGPLDKQAGDGNEVKSAIPIVTESKAIRKALSRLWKDSRWAINKDVMARLGAALGDVAIKVCDDPARKRITLKVLHPGTVKWVDRDHDSGQVTGYTLEETRYNPHHIQARNLSPSIDPTSMQFSCLYNEQAFVDGKDVVYRTFMDGGPFDWRLKPDGTPYGNGSGAMPEWKVPYGFVPLVLIQHMAIGMPWGLAEPHIGLGKFDEIADVGSNVGDYVRRILNDATAISGVANPKDDVKATGDTPTAGNPEPGRTKRRMLYLSDPNAKVQHLTGALDVGAVAAHIQALKDDQNEDYPELDLDLWKSGDPSGRALKIARQRAEAKVQMRRTNYDEGLEAAQRYGMAMGGIRGYDAYRGLGSDDPLNDPKLDHAIDHRPVFAPDPVDDIEEGKAFWDMVGSATAAGMPLEVILRREGWPLEDINEIMEAKAANDQRQMNQAQQRMDMAGANADGSADDQGDEAAVPDDLFTLNLNGAGKG
jgi:hypothetical protein